MNTEQASGHASHAVAPAAGRRRLWIMYHGLVVLLVAHFAAVHLYPQWFVAESGYRGVWKELSRPAPKRAASKILESEDGRTLLYGGRDESSHFDISQCRIEPRRLRYGLGREAFPALIEPRFTSAEQASTWLGADEKVLAVRIDQTVRVYPVQLLIRHEVVNDVVAGVPIFAAYCILADLGAVYDRRYGDHTLTFALSGYTYADPEVWDGRNAFVLWDRETESLWWPPIGKAVAGPLIDRSLHLLDTAFWSQTTWGQIAERFPHATVLERGQDFERPQDWPRLDPAMHQSLAASDQPPPIAPRWGENALP